MNYFKCLLSCCFFSPSTEYSSSGSTVVNVKPVKLQCYVLWGGVVLCDVCLRWGLRGMAQSLEINIVWSREGAEI